MIKLLNYIVKCIAYALGWVTIFTGGIISLLMWDIRHVYAAIELIDQIWED